MMFDFAIVGAGPAGSMAALHLAKKGYRVAVFEEHKKIGLPVRCAGLVSERVVKMHKEGIVNEIRGAIVVFPNGKEITIGGDRRHAFVIDRRIFDSTVAERAMAAGAKYIIGKRVGRINERGDFFEVNGIKARHIIGADGPKSTVAKRFGMGRIGFFNAIQGYGKYEGEYVKIFLNNKIAPHFFAWIVPADRARIGLATTRKNILSYFRKFLKMSQMEAKDITAGLIPFGLRKFRSGNVALVGDAAGQVKATSGGGLYAGLSAAITLADNFYEYEKNYAFLAELKKCLAIRKIMMKLGDRFLGSIAGIIENGIGIINEYGDIDYPSIVVKELIKRLPFLLK